MKYLLTIFIAFLIVMGCSEDNGTNAEVESQEILLRLEKSFGEKSAIYGMAGIAKWNLELDR